MLLWNWLDPDLIRETATGEAASGMWSAAGRWHLGVAVGVTAVAGIALFATIIISSRRTSHKSPWSARRKQVLNRPLWDSLFIDGGKLGDAELFLEKVRSGGIEPDIRPLVWPFLLGVYDLNSTEDERSTTRTWKRKAYKMLRKKCKLFSETCEKNDEKDSENANDNEGNNELDQAKTDSPKSGFSDELDKHQLSVNGMNTDTGESQSNMDAISPDPSVEAKEKSVVTDADAPPHDCDSNTGESQSHLDAIGSDPSAEAEEKSVVTDADAPPHDCDSTDSESSIENPDSVEMLMELLKRENINGNGENNQIPSEKNNFRTHRSNEDFTTWQRIIRLDAIRANDEWIPYAPEQARVSPKRAQRYAKNVGLEDYDHLETCRIYHAARLVAILEAYAVYDPEIGYCQGMSDLLSPILAVIEEDDLAFWCFVGFMRKARHNFRLDEIGIRRQLNLVSKIIKFRDGNLFRHLEKLQAEDCFFVYRMVVVLFRRELNFEQTLSLWEVMWADQAAIRAGIGKSTWIRIRQNAPPTDDLLLYAIAASVLQRRKLIIEKYYSMDEIMKECQSMAGNLDVWKLLDDAHALVLTLHKKIS